MLSSFCIENKKTFLYEESNLSNVSILLMLLTIAMLAQYNGRFALERRFMKLVTQITS